MLKKMNCKYLDWLVYVYLLLPIAIFFVGWMRWYFALPFVLLLLIACIKAIRSKEQRHIVELTAENKKVIGLAVVVIGVWVYLSGIGGFMYQNGDQLWRNQIFRMLVEYDWPVVQEFTFPDGVETRGMVYYLAFWMPAALVGKVFGLTAGFFAQAIWAILGVMLVFYLLCRRFNKISIGALIGLIFFSGLDIVGAYIANYELIDLYKAMHIEWWAVNFQYSCFTTQLFWVFNQAIYAWILTLMIWQQKDNRKIVLLWSCGLLSCTLPFVGMLPLLIYKMLKNARTNHDWIRGCMTIENVLIGGMVGILSFIYLRSNVSAQVIKSVSSGMRREELFVYFLFVFLEAGVYFLFVYKENYRNGLFWLALLCLLICPWIRVGGFADFCMRASIPWQMILFVMVMEELWRRQASGNRNAYRALMIVLVLGAVTPAFEIIRPMKNALEWYREDKLVVPGFVEESEVMLAPNFSADTEGNLFFNYIAR